MQLLLQSLSVGTLVQAVLQDKTFVKSFTILCLDIEAHPTMTTTDNKSGVVNNNFSHKGHFE